MLLKLNLKILFICCLFLASCYEPQDDCLDVLAKNYSLTADLACEDCCTYPDLTVRVFQKFDTLLVSKLDTFSNTLGQSIVFHNLEILASNFQLLTESGESKSVQDSIDINSIIDGVAVTTRVVDDVILIRPNQFTYELGMFALPDTYKSISLNVGLSDPLNYVVRDDLDEDDVLINNADTLYISQQEGFVFARLEVQTDPTDSLSLVTYDLYGDNLNISHNWSIDTTYIRGNDIQIELYMDYKDWLNDIDWEDDYQTTLSSLELRFKDLFK